MVAGTTLTLEVLISPQRDGFRGRISRLKNKAQITDVVLHNAHSPIGPPFARYFPVPRRGCSLQRAAAYPCLSWLTRGQDILLAPVHLAVRGGDPFQVRLTDDRC